jgi:hypothetical protein
MLNNKHWRFLLDSYASGEQYRSAEYGQTNAGLPLRNLVRHKRELPLPNSGEGGRYRNLPGNDPGYIADDDDYEYRRALTPVPDVLRQTIDKHLARIFSRSIHREIADDANELDVVDASGVRLGKQAEEQTDAYNGPLSFLEEWWEDVDGNGTTIDSFMRKTIAPLLLASGQIDVIVDRPAAPEGVKIVTKADEETYGVDKIVVGFILPEHVVWWRLCSGKREYEEVVIREAHEDAEGQPKFRYRHWTTTDSTLYEEDGKLVANVPHSYGRVPIRRFADGWSTVHRNVGVSAYEAIAIRQRTIYNRMSELILADTYQAFPIMQCPETMLSSDGSVSVGPNYILKMVPSPDQSRFQGFEAVEIPTTGIDSIRKNITDDLDACDRSAALTKPAGMNGKGTVGQSGISKELDQQDGNAILSERAQTLCDVERGIAELVLIVGLNRPPTIAERQAVSITYPLKFDLYTSSDLADLIERLQGILDRVSELPTLSYELLSRLVNLMLPGLTATQQEAVEDELEAFVEQRSREAGEQAEAVEASTPLGSGVRQDLDDNSSGMMGEAVGAAFAPTKTMGNYAY